MKTYVSQLGITYKHHNKAEAAALLLAEKFNRRIIPEEQVKTFIAEFTNAIDHLNRSYPRCKDLRLEVNDYFGEQDFDISISGLFHLYLYWGV